MSITPQLIKDQEFEVKFRGFDPIEVKDYLENIADHFFELQEKCKEQEEELEGLHEAKDSSAELKDGCAQKEEQINELTTEVEELQLRIADMEKEKEEQDEEMSFVEADREETEEALQKEKKESESLRNKIEVLQEQVTDLKKEEIDFRSTLASAQRFAEDLKEKSKTEAEEMLEDAEKEIEQIRNDAQAELDRLPKEIEILENKKHKVKAELKAILENYLETIDVFSLDDREGTEEQQTVSEQEGDELFQKIELNEDGSISPEDVPNLGSSEEDQTAVREMDEKVLESLLRGEEVGGDEEESSKLKEVFSLETEEKEKKKSS